MGHSSDQPHVLAAAYDPWLISLSILIAVVASFAALDLGALVAVTSPKSRGAHQVQLAGAAVVIGGGIWSMHFVAMLAHDLALATTPKLRPKALPRSGPRLVHQRWAKTGFLMDSTEVQQEPTKP